MHLLAVCTGNICRSPSFERVLRASGIGHGGVTVTSVGTEAVIGAPIHSQMARLVRERGADVEQFEARALSVTDIEEADLVVVMTREHRRRIVELSPAHVRRTFTLTELARIANRIDSASALGSSVVGRFAVLIHRAPALRTAAAAPKDDDIADPNGGRSRDYERAMGKIIGAVNSLERVLLD